VIANDINYLHYTPKVFAMKSLRLLLIILVSFTVSCTKKENPYRMEMDGLLHENKSLNEAIQKAEDKSSTSTEFAKLLQGMNEKLLADSETKQKRIEELSVQNDDLRVQLGVITEREREAHAKIRAIENQKEDAKRQEDLKRQQSLAAITAANQSTQPPFRVYDSMFIGKKEINGRLRDAGRLSIRNYTDQQLTVGIESIPFSTTVQVPPNSSSNSVYVGARRGEQISIRGSDHTEKITW